MIDKTHYSLALASQGACNMSGIVIAFAEALKAMCAEGLDTEARNKHPISILYAAQISYLAGTDPGWAGNIRGYFEVLKACEKGAGK